MQKPFRIVVVGAGISGLSLAYRLQQRLPDADIHVLDSDSRPGGTIWTDSQGGFQAELGPNGFLDNKPSTLTLARDLGLGDRLVSASDSAGTNRYLFLGDGLIRLPSGPADLLKTPLLSWRGKISFLMERLRPGRQLADESIDAFARRRVGVEAADVFADAMVTGIFAGDPAKLSLPACFPRLAELERTYGSIIKGFAATARQRRREANARGEPYQRSGKLWSFQGGLRILVETIVASLKRAPRLGIRVTSLEKADSWTVHAEGCEPLRTDVVALTCPAHAQAKIVSHLDADLATRLAEIPFNKVAVVALGYRHGDIPGGLDGFGFISPQRLGRDLLGVQWCSSIFPGRAPEGHVLLRAMCGGTGRPDVANWDNASLIHAVRDELQRVQNITANPVFTRIQRWQPAIPQYHLGHVARLDWIDAHLTRHPGLYLAGNSYRGVSMNDCTEQASRLAEQIAKRS